MEKEADNLNLIDLLNSKYYKFKKMNEDLCTSSYKISLSNTEWSVINQIHGNQPTISEIVQLLKITRQATHKCIKALNSKGILTINNVVNNNKKKCLVLTPLGEQLYLDNILLKEAIERDIAVQLGVDNMTLLISLLNNI